MNSSDIDFTNTQIAFQTKSNQELRNSYILFKAIGYNWLVQAGPKMVDFAFSLGLPIKGIIKKTVFHQFCGGENIQDCEKNIQLMHQFKVGTILDYSVEGEEREEVFETTAQEIIQTILKAKGNAAIPFSVFKVTGVARFNLLAKVNAKENLSESEQAEFRQVKRRINMICELAHKHQVRLFIDAEESWIQDAIDEMVMEMMMLYNKERAIVYNTIQFYRHDRLDFLKKSIAHAQANNYFYGVKLVRGAYMEKEALRAKEFNYINPIQPNKEASDRDYNAGLAFCLNHIPMLAICAGTHNEESCKYLITLMQKAGLEPNDERVYFSQLFGMSDNLSYNLANAGYRVAKYLPYGPVKAVMPYLFRRAQENTSVQGQAGRELSLVQTELRRRNASKG
ncbi:MAG: proline dehydrogenase family protein [Bacteroidota bacterium]|nr:proline dehydrogenase family protein [Bacteroidota bacterium]